MIIPGAIESLCKNYTCKQCDTYDVLLSGYPAGFLFISNYNGPAFVRRGNQLKVRQKTETGLHETLVNHRSYTSISEISLIESKSLVFKVAKSCTPFAIPILTISRS